MKKLIMLLFTLTNGAYAQQPPYPLTKFFIDDKFQINLEKDQLGLHDSWDKFAKVNPLAPYGLNRLLYNSSKNADGSGHAIIMDQMVKFSKDKDGNKIVVSTTTTPNSSAQLEYQDGPKITVFTKNNELISHSECFISMRGVSAEKNGSIGHELYYEPECIHVDRKSCHRILNGSVGGWGGIKATNVEDMKNKALECNTLSNNISDFLANSEPLLEAEKLTSSHLNELSNPFYVDLPESEKGSYKGTILNGKKPLDLLSSDEKYQLSKFSKAFQGRNESNKKTRMHHHDGVSGLFDQVERLQLMVSSCNHLNRYGLIEDDDRKAIKKKEDSASSEQQ